MNDSLSLSMRDVLTTTTVEPSNELCFTIDGVVQSEAEHEKVSDFLAHFTDEAPHVHVRSKNPVPTGAGMASSAAGFAALGVAANAYFNANLDTQRLATIVRRGSGSAVRSLLGGAVVWHRDGSIESVAVDVEAWRMVFVVIDDRRKTIGSREAMRRTVATSPTYDAFVNRADSDVKKMISALQDGDLDAVGQIMEANQDAMHEAMAQAVPPIVYRSDASHRARNLITTLRARGIIAYATMDAGPNVKVLVEERMLTRLKSELRRAGFARVLVSRIATVGAVVIDEN